MTYRQVLQSIAIMFTVALGVVIFLYPLSKPMPPGVDAAVYLNDAHWIIDHNALPKSGQITYHGSTAYPAPLTALNAAIVSQVTDWPLIFPAFSIYQAFLIVLLLGSCYLVGSIYSRSMAILFPLAVLGSHALIRLFIGSTVSNILAFIFINCIFYFVHDYVAKKRQANLILIGLFLAALYFTHSYLTAPLFIPVFIVYFLLVVFSNPKLRANLFASLKRWPWWLKIAVPVAMVSAAVGLVLYYIPVFREARYSFFLNQVTSKFAGAIPVDRYQQYLGFFIFVPGVLGLIAYLLQPKKNLLSYRALPFLWIIVLLGLLQLYHLNINFFYERLVFLGGIFICFFAAYFVDWIIKGRSRALTILAVVVFATQTVISGTVYANTLYDKSNLATPDQVKALTILRDSSKPTDLVFSHINGVSETYHDVIVSDRDIVYLTTKAVNCAVGDARCLAFTTPEAESSYEYFKTAGVKYFLFMKPSQEGNKVLDELLSRYTRTKHYQLLYKSDRAFLYTLSGE